MPKCVRCNRWGPFLKLNSGLCDKCIAETESRASTLIMMAQSYADKINNATTPSEFFSCYSLLVEDLEELSDLEKYVSFSGTLPSVTLREISEEERYTSLALDMMNRATEKNKRDVFLLEHQLDIYKEKMPLKLWNRLENELKKRKSNVVKSVQSDPALIQAMDLCVSQGWCSTAFLQRNMKIGYAASAEYLDKMEENGWVEPWSATNKGIRKLLASEIDWKIIRNSYREKAAPDTVPLAMDGHQFEHYCADLLLKNGFSKAEVTQASGDYGIDVLAEKDDVTYGIQCKYYTDKVGNHAVQEALSGAQYYHCMVAVVMTNSDFTPAAVETARKTNVLLWNGKKIEEMANK